MRQRVINFWSLAGLVALAGGLTGTALGQTFSLGSNPIEAAPGETVVVPVFVTGGPSNTSALNFTVSANNNGDANIGGVQHIEGSITGSKSTNSALTNFQYQDNSISRAEGQEYRAVVYAPSSGSGTVDTSGQTHIANLSITIKSSAQDGDKINLWFDRAGGTHSTTGFDSDGITALVGVSDANGNSIVPSGTPSTARPNRSMGTIQVKVNTQTTTIADVPFDGEPDVLDLWEFKQSFPNESRFAATNANPFQIGVTGNNVFGFFGSKNVEASRFKPLGANRLVRYEFTYSTDQDNKTRVSPVRIRVNAGDKTVANLADFAQYTGTNRAFIPVQGAPTTIENIYYVYPENMDGTGETGFAAYMDVNALGAYSGTNVYVNNFQAEELPEASLQNKQTVLELDFRGQANGFVAKKLGSANGGSDAVTTTATADGLQVDPNGTTQYPAEFNYDSGNPSGFVFHYGWWEGNINGWTVEAGKLYEVQFTVVGTNASAANANTVRLRVRPQAQNDYVNELQLSSASTSHPNFYTSAGNAKTYKMFLLIPSDFVGRQMFAAFDVWNELPGDTGAVTLQDIKIYSYDNPF